MFIIICLHTHAHAHAPARTRMHTCTHTHTHTHTPAHALSKHTGRKDDVHIEVPHGTDNSSVERKIALDLGVAAADSAL